LGCFASDETVAENRHKIVNTKKSISFEITKQLFLFDSMLQTVLFIPFFSGS
jgi:hypothetical protein